MFWLGLVSPNSAPHRQGGFSLIELLVSIGIVVLVLGVVVTRQNAFDGAVLLRSQAYEIALAIREVQVSAVSEVNTGDGFGVRRGVYIQESANELLFFSDGDGDNFQDADEIYGVERIDSRFEIVAISPTSGSLPGDDVAIVFERPNFDAMFYDDPSSPASAGGVEIRVAPRGGSATGGACGVDYRTVVVTLAGQITVVEC